MTVGPAASRTASSSAAVIGVVEGDHPIDQSQPFAGRRVDRLAEHQQLSGFAQTHDSRQQMDRAGIGQDPAVHESLDQAGLGGHHDEIAGQHQTGTGADGGPFTAATTGLSQSSIDATSRCQPFCSIRAISPGRFSETGAATARLSGQSRSRAEVALAGAVSSTARTVGHRHARGEAPAKASRANGDNEFPTSARSMVMRQMPPASPTITIPGCSRHLAPPTVNDVSAFRVS